MRIANHRENHMHGKGKLKPSVIKRGGHLMDVDFTTEELAEELGVSSNYVRKGLIGLYGLPAKRAASGRLWINGAAFSNWLSEYMQNYNEEKRKPKLKENEFYCVRCHKFVATDDFWLETTEAARFLKANCPVCGLRVNKITKRMN